MPTTAQVQKGFNKGRLELYVDEDQEASREALKLVQQFSGYDVTIIAVDKGSGLTTPCLTSPLSPHYGIESIRAYFDQQELWKTLSNGSGKAST